MIGNNANNVQGDVLNVKELYPHIALSSTYVKFTVKQHLTIDVIKSIMKMVVDVETEIKYSQVLSLRFTKISNA